jgi:hypothetical protein
LKQKPTLNSDCTKLLIHLRKRVYESCVWSFPYESFVRNDIGEGSFKSKGGIHSIELGSNQMELLSHVAYDMGRIFCEYFILLCSL